jgi:periplasmic protein TonB
MEKMLASSMKLLAESNSARTTASVLLHGLLFLAFSVHWWTWWATPMPAAGTTRGSRTMLLYLPGPPSPAPQAARRAAPVRRPAPKLVTVRMPTLQPPKLDPTAPIGIAQNDSSGTDALGYGSASIVSIQPFPRQNPDLSRLPSGSSGDLIVGVRIDNTGRVASAVTKKGLGYGVDEMLLATVQQWIFHPAMKDGHPVASEHELCFHYHLPGDPMTAGWESFTLVLR